MLRAVLNDPDQNFPQIPEGKHCLVDLGYLNTGGFIAPFHGIWYQHYEYRGANQLPRNAKELFNHRHCYLRNAKGPQWMNCQTLMNFLMFSCSLQYKNNLHTR